jgi:tRNA modification GTPase
MIRMLLSDVEQGRLGQLRSLAHNAPAGRHLVDPWKVVIAGAPNVGKSSLVNALAGYTRSIVAPTPGTTRDVVKTVLAIDGWPVELTDTAGLRPAEGSIEEEGITRARAAAAEADLCLWLVDGSAEPVLPDREGCRLAINKCDLPPAWDWSRFPEALRVSAKTGTGIGDLCDAISRWLVPEPPAPGEAVPFSPEACEEVLRLREA